MSVPAIALPSTAYGSLCDHDPHPNPKSIAGGLSRLFSSSPSSSSSRHNPPSTVSFGGDDTAADLTLTSSFSYSCSPSRSFSTSSSSFGVSAGKDRVFRSFITSALGSCYDYEGGIEVEELGFDLGESCVEPYVRELLVRAQSRHKVFNEEFVVRAFYEAEKAHRGQVKTFGIEA